MRHLWATTPERLAISQRGPFTVLTAKPQGQTWVDIIGIFSSSNAAQAEIDDRKAWKEHVKQAWRDK